ncbi:Trk system potassium transporter TrkA [Parvularcula dongshanensis]|uniref:Trk system potassium uptake protein TrkA n=1 Tax=Parvularcula dongshanensis TaxID=1173995 RepID=A0A840I750_9PROT|nr:Trk system potassium transporter TrkA [Parvularcula dongshanensis]MBB4660004.1 trk system potassium uptake protein TrkA [Parvularcula dongshanensis]
MRVIVCGAGRVGYGIAARLTREKANVTVIDRNPALIRGLAERLDVRGVVGSGSYPDVLVEAGAKEADMVIAVTASDEVNIVACQIAHSVFGIPTKIARIRAQAYLQTRYADVFSRDNIPIDVIISPEREVAEAVLQRLTTPAASDVKAFADGRIWAVGVRLREDCPVLETPLRQVRELFPDLHVTIVGVRRGNTLFRAQAADLLQAGDEVFFICAAEWVERALEILGEPQPRARRVILIGGGNIGYDVASALEAKGQVKIRLIELDEERAAFVAERLEKTIVLQGSGLDREVLREAGVADAEAVVALTNSDQVNVLAGVIAKREGARRANVLINEAEYGPLSHSVGIDRYIDPRATTISTILQHVRRGRIKAVYSLMDGAAELMDAVALQTSNLVGTPLGEAHLPPGVAIGAILRRGEVILPDSTTSIEPQDRVVLFALRESVEAVQKLFRVGIEYF